MTHMSSLSPTAQRLLGAAFLLLVLLLTSALAPSAKAQTLLETLVSPNEASGGDFGTSTAGVPDTNGDGVDDLLVGALFEGPGSSLNNIGRAYLFSGATGTLLLTLESPNSQEDGRFGTAVAGVSDVNGDGFGDLLVGAPGENRAYLLSGASGLPIYNLIPAASADAFGFSVAGVPDADGDDVEDLLVGTVNERVYLYSGATGTLLLSVASPSGEPLGAFGGFVAGVPDTDGDGRGDFLVGAPGEDPGSSPFDAGRAYLFSGATGTILSTLSSPNEESGGRFGDAVAGVPDTDGDGRGDLLIGAGGFFTTGESRAYLFSGASGGLRFELVPPSISSNSHFGSAVASVPDVDGDDIDDLLIGAPSAASGALFPGLAFLFNGATGAFLAEIQSPNEQTGGNFGEAVAGIPDVDGDGAGDLLIGARNEDPGSSPFSAGRAYLFSGSGGGSTTPDVDLSAMATSPTTVAPGDTLAFDYTLTNTTGMPISGALRAEVRDSTGTTVRRFGRVVSGTLAGGETLSGSFMQTIPENAAPGTYTYVLVAETDDGDVLDDETFEITVTSDGSRPALAGAATWPAPVFDGGFDGAGDDTQNAAAARVERTEAVAAYPNPTAGRARIAFSLEEAAEVRLTVYDALGREVAELINGRLGTGRHAAVLDGEGLPTGVYLWRFEAGGRVETGRLTLLR